MQRVFLVLLASAISMMMTVGTNAHEQCKLDEKDLKEVCPKSGPPCDYVFEHEDAACLIANSVIVQNDCRSPDGAAPASCETVEHRRYLKVVHQTYGYTHCMILTNRHLQEVMCVTKSFGDIW